MRIVRYTPTAGGLASYGVLDGEGEHATVTALDGPPYEGVRRTGEPVPLAEVTLLAPVEPSKVVAFGRNYAEHAKELGNEVPAVPLVFLKPSTAVVGPGVEVPYPR